MGFTANALKDARKLVVTLTEASRISIGTRSAAAGVDRATTLALDRILINTEQTKSILRPSPADDRSLL